MPEPIDAEELRRLRDRLRERRQSAEVETQVVTEWVGQALSRTQVIRWRKPADTEAARPATVHTVLVDEPTSFLGTDVAPKPTEMALAALGSCLVVGMVYHAALEGMTLQRLTLRLSARLSRTGFLGLDDTVRPGFTGIDVAIEAEGPHAPAEWDRLLERVIRTSPVLDMLRNPVPVTVARRS